MRKRLFILTSLLFVIAYSEKNMCQTQINVEKGIQKKAEKFFNKMTLEEKQAQLNGIRPNDLMEKGQLSIKLCKEKIHFGIGRMSHLALSLNLPPNQLRDFVRQLQNYLIKQIHSGVPAIFHEEAITGFCTLGAISFPYQIGMSCIWNPEFVMKNTKRTAKIKRQIRVLMTLSPKEDVIKNAHWSCIEEGFGEDAYLTSRIVQAFVQGLKENNLQTVWSPLPSILQEMEMTVLKCKNEINS